MKLKVYCDCEGKAALHRQADKCARCIQLKPESNWTAHEIGLHYRESVDTFIGLDGKRHTFLNHCNEGKI